MLYFFKLGKRMLGTLKGYKQHGKQKMTTTFAKEIQNQNIWEENI